MAITEQLFALSGAYPLITAIIAIVLFLVGFKFAKKILWILAVIAIIVAFILFFVFNKRSPSLFISHIWS